MTPKKRKKLQTFSRIRTAAMFPSRCAICRRHMPSVKNLKFHYFSKHSKIQIIRQLLKNCFTGSSFLKKPNKHKKLASQPKTIYSHDNVHIAYKNNIIIIEDGSNTDNLIEFTFERPPSNSLAAQDNTSGVPFQVTVTQGPEKEGGPVIIKKRLKRKPKNLQRFHIEISKGAETPKLLDEHTGKFYNGDCSENQKSFSDTESGSDTSRTFYCKSCGNGYANPNELFEHEKLHTFHCRICDCHYDLQYYRQHFDQHLVRIYVCHLCNFEFIFKKALMEHLNYHFEQQVFEDVLNMERDYNMYNFSNTNVSGGDRDTNINNIVRYLAYPYDHYYSRNMFMKIVCDICKQDMYTYEYERHMKVTHFMP